MSKEKEKEKLRSRKRYWADVEKSRERSKKYYETHKDVREKWKDNNKKYVRASQQYQKYKIMDLKNGFGDVIDFDPQWIIDNIYTKSCPHCKRSGWEIMGCNRLDNSKPHTKDNVEPCCKECNVELAKNYISEKHSIQIDQIDKVTGEVIHKWKNSEEAAKQLKCNASHIRSCARGERKTHNGYIWKSPNMNI